MSASISIMCNSNDGVKKTKITVSSGDDLFRLSKEREIYRNNFIVSGFSNGKIRFNNGVVLSEGQAKEVYLNQLCVHRLTEPLRNS